MKKKAPASFFLFAASVGFIVVALFTTFLINTNKESPADIRAKAGVLATLKYEGLVVSVDDVNGTVTIDSLTLSDESRSGAKKNLGRWVVTAPPQFNLVSASTGTKVKLTIDPKTFDIARKTLTAKEITR